ncbi:hypothetical protein [Lacrimispora sp. JR3]|uniref:hypothetical protein n=1 Tax=Lacrimispora sinapis TaxID=3111456 RepID=UPI00374A4200
MKRKICPICDLPVNEVNYCRQCKKVIRRPVLWEVNYYLNEKRPENENPRSVPPRTGTQGGAAIPGRTAAPSPATIPDSSGHERKAQGRKFHIPIAGLATLFFVIAGAAPDVMRKADQILDRNISYETAAPSEDPGIAPLSEEKVIADGIPCDGYTHFPVDGKTIADGMGQYINENNYGYQLMPEDLYSDNYELELEDGWVSYYETFIGYYLEDEKTSQLNPDEEGYVYQYVEVNYDTGTGEMHDYISSMNNEEACLDYLEHFFELTETAGGVSKEESSLPILMERIRAGLTQGDMVDLAEGMFRVSVYREGDMVRAAVSFHDFPSSENNEL